MFFLLGCFGEPKPAEDPGEVSFVVQAESASAVANVEDARTESGGQPVEVDLTWTGVGGLHQSYFSDVEAVRILQSGLGGGLAGGRVVVEVAWDNETYRGTIRAHVRQAMVPGGLQLKSGGVALGRLVPVTRALADYRDHVASRFDVRVLSFHLEVEVDERCRVSAGGDHPPNGASLSPCVAVGSEKICGTSVPGGVNFASNNPDLSRCFGVGQ